MDTRDTQDGVTRQGNTLVEGEPARVGATPSTAPAPQPQSGYGPALPGGPYAPYQPTQPTQPAGYGPVGPAVSAQPAPPRREGLRATNPVLWTVLLIFGVLLTGAVILAILAVLFAARITGEIGTAQVGPLQNDSRSAPLGATKSVDVELTMRAGDLKLAGGATDLLNADFSYNVSQWKPQISSSIAGESGALIVTQPEQGVFAAGKTVNRWDLRLNNGVPLSLKANVGAGSAEFRLAGLNITRAEVIVGAGTTTVDMTGMAGQNADIRVINSVGDTTLVLPRDVGVKVSLVRGAGNVSPGDLKGSGNSYTNDAYGKAGRTINLNVEVAAGNVVFQTR